MSGAAQAQPQLDGRSARRRATRARIVAAAAELFVADGYSSTSVEAVAARAGVGVQTVYHAFGTKRAILSAALDVAVAGDDEPTPTLDRSWVHAAVAAADPVDQLRHQVAGAAAIHARAAALLDVVRSAAAVDPELAETWERNIEQRRIVQQHLITALVGKAALRAGLDEADAVDICLAVLSPEIYHLLVVVRGWTSARWQDWALDALARQLIDADAPAGG